MQDLLCPSANCEVVARLTNLGEASIKRNRKRLKCDPIYASRLGAALKIGLHVSASGGVFNSVANAKALGCTAFQMFTRSPRGWHAKDLAKGDISQFKNALSASGINAASVAVHMPYLPNLSAPPGDLYTKSVSTLKQEAKRCVDLEISKLVVHLGSYLSTGEKAGSSQLLRALRSALEDNSISRGDLVFLLENSAGQKNRLGSQFEDLRLLLDALDDTKRFGICFDTCHAFAAGYDMQTAGAVTDTLEKFDRTVGLASIRLVHLNDSKGPLASKLDRHDHIGLGKIGAEGLGAFLQHADIRSVPVILETPKKSDGDDRRNLDTARKLAGS